jgi:hypothetical protein
MKKKGKDDVHFFSLVIPSRLGTRGQSQTEVTEKFCKTETRFSYDKETIRLALIYRTRRHDASLKSSESCSDSVAPDYLSLLEASTDPRKPDNADQQRDNFFPPSAVELALFYILPQEDRAAQIGDLQEEFSLIADKFGLQAARRWYWFQGIRTVGLYIGNIVYKLLRLGIFMKAASWAAQKLGV